jgi:putative FmdB family regulatory protein
MSGRRRSPLPTYEYACTACGHRLEAVQRFSDDPLTECPECEAPLRKVYGNVGIVLKGSGFYKTDSRAAASRANGSGAKGAEKSSAESSGTDSTPQKETAAAGSKDSGGDAKPAATAAD